MITTSHIILKNLLKDQAYHAKVKDFLREEYFEDDTERNVYLAIRAHAKKYDTSPTKETLVIDIINNAKLTDKQIDKAGELVVDLAKDTSNDPQDWLLEQTEKWCKDQAVYRGIMDAIALIEENKKGKNKADTSVIPELLREAINVSFEKKRPDVWDADVADFDSYWKECYDPGNIACKFDLTFFDKLTRGGLRKGKLMVIVAPTSNGKSQILCHMAAEQIRAGKKVLYVHYEMEPQEIIARIASSYSYTTSNRFSVEDCENDLGVKKLYRVIDPKLYKIVEAQETTVNYIVRKIEDLKRKGWTPDVVLIDYLEKMTDERRGWNSSDNTNDAFGGIVNDIQQRICRKYRLPVIIPQQTNREGIQDASDGKEIKREQCAKAIDPIKHADYIVGMTYFKKGTVVERDKKTEKTETLNHDYVYFQNWKIRGNGCGDVTSHRRVKVDYRYSRFIDAGGMLVDDDEIIGLDKFKMPAGKKSLMERIKGE